MTTLEFNNLSDRCHNALLAFALKLTTNREDAKDLCQETVMRAFVNKDRFTVGTNFKAWITTIMRNSFINEYRKRSTRNKVEQPFNNEFINKNTSDNNGPSNVIMEELNLMLNNLGLTHQVPFEMFFNGYGYQEIAYSLELPMGTVKSRIFFARKKLKTMIRSQFGNEYFRYA